MHNNKVTLLAATLGFIFCIPVSHNALAQEQRTQHINNANHAQNVQVQGINPNLSANQSRVTPRRFTIETYKGADGQEHIKSVEPTTMQTNTMQNSSVNNSQLDTTLSQTSAVDYTQVRPYSTVAQSNNSAMAKTSRSNVELNQGQNTNQAITTDVLTNPSASEINNRQYVDNQLYPATNNKVGRDAFPIEATEAVSGSVSSNQRGFTVVNNQEQAGSSTDVIDPNFQEVTVPLLSTIDAAILDGFKSLESGITLGLGQDHKFSLEEVAPALAGFSYDVDGNLVLKFNINNAKHIIEQSGSKSWEGLSNPILLWMVGLNDSNSNNGASLALVSGQNLSSFAQAILNAAPDYKYRIIYPILDLEDVQKVKVDTVLSQKETILADASKRYGSDYFVAALLNSAPNESQMTLKWSLYNKDGFLIAESSMSGLMDEVASLSAGDIARALMTYRSALTEKEEQSNLTINNVDIAQLGPGNGFVRLKIANVKTLSDIQALRKALVKYGYDGDTRVIGYDNGLLVFEVITNSDPNILVETMRRAGDFNYLAPWMFSYNNDSGFRPKASATVGKASYSRPNSIIDPERRQASRVIVRDSRDIGNGDGLPNRNKPAIQGSL